MGATLLKFTQTHKHGEVFYFFEGFENVKPRCELPCEYLSGVHFATWNGVLLYSDGRNLFTLSPGSEISEAGYRKLIQVVKVGTDRLKEINAKNKQQELN